MCFCLGKKKCWYKSLPSQYLNSPRHFFPLTYAWKCFAWQGFKLTKQSMWRSTPNWLAVSANRYPAGHFMSNQQSLGLQLAQLGRDASAAVSRSHCELLKKKKRLMEGLYCPFPVFIFLVGVFQGAARRLNTQKKHVEIESVGVAGKSDSNRVKKYFRLEVWKKNLAIKVAFRSSFYLLWECF